MIRCFYHRKKKYDKKVRSIKIYRAESSYDSVVLAKELFFDFEGKLIKCARHSRDYAEPSLTYFFYTDAGKIFLEVRIGENKYDTIYTYRNFDKQNRYTEEISYYVTSKELNKLTESPS
jgi:hypothetical protein